MNQHSRCSVCGAHVQQQTTTYTQDIAGHLAVVTDVPVLACPQCGEQYFTPEIVDSLQLLIKRGGASGQAPKTIQVPVYPFSHM
jgi:YgiT-type zinc finger domain-containing protein